jgi:hypothetical protein
MCEKDLLNRRRGGVVAGKFQVSKDYQSFENKQK